MSGNLAYTLPARSPREHVEEHPRHIEIVTTRSQKKARPRVVYAIVGVFGLFAIFIAQLLLSILLSDGAYQISALQSQQKELLRTEQALGERIALLSSTQNVAAQAAALGMVANSNPVSLIRLSDGATLGAAAAASDAAPCGATCNLVPNALLSGVPIIDPTAIVQSSTGQTTQPAAPPLAETPSDGLPAPVTR